MQINLDTLTAIANLAIFPALGYLIALERRLVRLETQLALLLNTLTTKGTES